SRRRPEPARRPRPALRWRATRSRTSTDGSVVPCDRPKLDPRSCRRTSGDSRGQHSSSWTRNARNPQSPTLGGEIPERSPCHTASRCDGPEPRQPLAHTLRREPREHRVDDLTLRLSEGAPRHPQGRLVPEPEKPPVARPG